MNNTWFQVYEAHFGKKLNPGEVEVWEDEIELHIRNLGAAEIVGAVRSISEDRRKKGGGNKYPPTLDDLVTAIIRGRYVNREGVNPGEGVGGHRMLVADLEHGEGHWKIDYDPESSWKSRLHRADPEEAWNIICEPATPDEVKERERYCIEHRIAYKRFIPLRQVSVTTTKPTERVQVRVTG